MWLHNYDWKMLPTTAFGDVYPSVLTCKDHDGGFSLIKIICCRWRTNILSRVSDKVCHTVVKTWSLKHIKDGYNSTVYQMLEQRSSRKVPDTINVSSVGKTDHGSILIKEAKARL